MSQSRHAPDRPWVFRTYSGHSSARASNALYRQNLAKGQTGLSVAFDLPTQTGFDSDHPLARGEVGKVGVPICHLEDLLELFEGLPLDRMNTSMTINATAAWLLALFVAAAERTGVDPRGICALSALVEARSGVRVPPNKAVVGANAFRHASGIHQDGVLKWRENYEVLDPARIGHARGSEIVLGKLSGRAGFVARVQALGYTLTDSALERAFERFQRLADRKALVEDGDLKEICEASVAAA